MRPLSVMSKHDCAKHGHVERSTHWGLSCLYCGLALPERPERIDGEGGRWHALGDYSRIWVKGD